MTVKSDQPAVRIGFGEADLWGCWKTSAQLQDEIKADCLVIESQSELIAVLLTCDLLLVSPPVSFELRKIISERAGLPVEKVVFFCTQNHGTPVFSYASNPVGDYSVLANRLYEAVEDAIDNLSVAECSHVVSRAVEPRVIRRRIRFDDAGAFTFWYGYRTLASGEADASDLLKSSLSGLLSGDTVLKCPQPGGVETSAAIPEVGVPFLMSDEADDLVQGLFFRTPGGEPLGSVVRCAAHPATANIPSNVAGGDYPVYARRRLAEKFGGKAIFLTGPCGDQAFVVEKKSVEFAKKVGTAIGDIVLSKLSAAHWGRLAIAHVDTKNVTIPLRTDIPVTEDALRDEVESVRKELASKRTSGASPTELKRIADRLETLSYWLSGNMGSWTGLSFADLSRGSINHRIYALRMNDTVILGLPGEPVGAYSRKLREAMPAHINLVVCEECNGYLGYIPTAEDCPDGGYEVCASPFDEEAEPVFLKQASDLARSLFA